MPRKVERNLNRLSLRRRGLKGNPDQRRKKELEVLLKERENIRGSLRMDEWLTNGLTYGGIGSIIAGVALAAADMKEVGIALVAAGGLAQIGSMARYMWPERKQVGDLDRVQEILHRKHRVFPDQGYFERAHQASSRRTRALNRIKAGEDAYDTNPFGFRSLKPPYRF